MNNGITVTEKDELIMRLVHYFVTKENYSPILVNGVKNEIWLENLEANYRIIRINSNYIHNKEQFEFDLYKIENVNKQISKKTLTRKLKTLNILTDANEDLKLNNTNEIDNYIINTSKDLEKKDGIISLYPLINEEEIKDLHGLDFLLNVSNDINKKTERENRFYEKVFSEKNTIVTKMIIILNIIISLFALLAYYSGKFDMFSMFGLNTALVKKGEWYRLITSGFLHSDIIHLLCNMYSLHVLGTQMESFIGKKKFLAVYIASLMTGSLLSCATGTYLSIGASGAIFGLLGSMLYFGYHYRIYLGSVLKNQIIPILLLNLFLSFAVPGIDAAGHIGGLAGGFLATIAVGIERKTKKSESINGLICFLILCAFLVFLILK